MRPKNAREKRRRKFNILFGYIFDDFFALYTEQQRKKKTDQNHDQTHTATTAARWLVNTRAGMSTILNTACATLGYTQKRKTQ